MDYMVVWIKCGCLYVNELRIFFLGGGEHVEMAVRLPLLIVYPHDFHVE